MCWRERGGGIEHAMETSSTLPNSRRKNSTIRAVVLPITIVLFLLAVAPINFLYLLMLPASSNDFEEATFINNRLLLEGNHEIGIPKETPKKNHLKFAIMSSFVHTEDVKSDKNAPKINDLDHVLNKLCYCDLWGYDYILNTTFGFSKSWTEKAHWLNYGTWHRVPHIQARLHEYDWLLYADIDFLIQDVTIPLESMIKEFQQYGKDIHIVLPTDANKEFTFSAFAVFVRNSPFGRRVVENWMSFAKGICPKGNINTTVKGKYDWKDTDQPGLWYALAETHREFFAKNDTEAPRMLCNQTTGYFETERALGPELNKYFKYMKAVKGVHGKDLSKVPSHQPIIWSLTDNETRSGLGIQQTYGKYAAGTWPHGWAIHKKEFPTHLRADLMRCRHVQGCQAAYDEKGVLQMGCSKMRVVNHSSPTNERNAAISPIEML